jgi:hypothetical protein
MTSLTPDPGHRAALRPAADPAIWRALGVFGAVLAGLAALDLAALWIPDGPTSIEELFGTVGTLFDRFPQLGLGFVLLLAAAVARGRRTAIRGMAVLAILLGVGLWLAAFLYLAALPYILQVSSAPEVHAHVRMGVLKTGLQATLYPLLLVLLAYRGWRVTQTLQGA